MGNLNRVSIRLIRTREIANGDNRIDLIKENVDIGREVRRTKNDKNS